MCSPAPIVIRTCVFDDATTQPLRMAVEMGENYLTCACCEPFSVLQCLVEDDPTPHLAAPAHSYTVEGQERALYNNLDVALATEDTHIAQTESGELHVLSLWGFCYCTGYSLEVVRGKEEVCSPSCTVSARTTPYPELLLFSFDPSVAPLIIPARSTPSRMAVLQRDDFYRFSLAQGATNEALALPSFDDSSLRGFADVIPWLLYHGLFALPSAVDKDETLIVLTIPNGASRFCIDLAATPSPNWRHSAKVRRAIRCGLWAVVVRNNRQDFADSLRRAAAYHLQMHGRTWLSPSYIDVLSSLCEGDTANVRFTSVELVRRDTGEVLAGCCGYGVGTLYCDATMYSAVRSKEGFGTFITKVLGEALEHCGYDLWYWGFCVQYMRNFEGRYGARSIPREEFLQRWVTGRRCQPKMAMEDYLKSGRGMVPYYTEDASMCRTD